jgi:hypothetical protein
MQRLGIARLCIPISIGICILIVPLVLAGCNSSRTENPVSQASAGQAAAKSSMDFMRKHVAEKKPASKTKRPTH